MDGANAQGYDTGIGGSTSTIVSPLGSPQPQLRSHAQRNAALARHMQVSAYFKILRYFVHKDAQIQRYKWVSVCACVFTLMTTWLCLFIEMKMEMGMGMGKHVLSFSLLWRKEELKGAKKRLCNCQNDSHFRLCDGEAPLLSIRNTFRSPFTQCGRGEASSTPLIGHCLCWRQPVKRLICF